jgi:hypothetical protein
MIGGNYGELTLIVIRILDMMRKVRVREIRRIAQAARWDQTKRGRDHHSQAAVCPL